jgi:hypothetical protein
MPASIFDKIRQKETPDKSYKWYQDIIRALGLASVQPAKVLRSDIGEFVTTINVGTMLLFVYEPKTKDTLPYYDTFPLVMPFRKVPGGFYGLNFHYLPPLLRMRLLEKMISYVSDTTLSDKSRFRLQWNLLNNAAKFPGVHACVKHYLYSHINSRIMQIHPKDWKKAIMLPVDNFEKASRTKVFKDSRDKL